MGRPYEIVGGGKGEPIGPGIVIGMVGEGVPGIVEPRREEARVERPMEPVRQGREVLLHCGRDGRVRTGRLRGPKLGVAAGEGAEQEKRRERSNKSTHTDPPFRVSGYAPPELLEMSGTASG